LASLQAAGASFITVHGRTRDQRGEPVNLAAIREIKQSVNIPVVANGDAKSMEDVKSISESTGSDGVMAARGMLENPAMFAGYDLTPAECIRDWVRLSLTTGTPFTCFHHHLIYMCEKSLSRAERRVFNSLSSTAAVLDYIRNVLFIDLI
jgi:tRNA-dihydrouridine synthase 4